MRNFNEIFRKHVSYYYIKSHKKPLFHHLFRRYIFWKPQGGRIKLTPHPDIIGLNILKSFHLILIVIFRLLIHSNDSHKKQKYSLEGSLVGVLFAAEHEFPKILVPRQPQNVPNVNIKSARKAKQLYYFCDQLLGALIYLHFVVLIIIYFWFIMLGVYFTKNGCFSLRTTPWS